MPSYFPVIKNGSNGAVFDVGLPSTANPGTFQVNPTLAVGDVKIKKDNGAEANITTLPVGSASSKVVQVTLSQTETNADNIAIIFSDAAGSEWGDVIVSIQTTARQIDDLAYPATSGRSLAVGSTGKVSIEDGGITSATFATGAIVLAKGVGITGFNDLSAAEVNAEVVDVIATDTYAEPAQGSPAATTSLAAKINYLFKAWRNKHTQTATQYSLYNDDAVNIDHKATTSDNGTTFVRAEISSGP